MGEDDNDGKNKENKKSWWAQPGVWASVAVFLMGLVLTVVGLTVDSASKQATLNALVYFGLSLVVGSAIMLAGLYIFQNISLKATYGGAEVDLTLATLAKNVESTDGINETVKALNTQVHDLATSYVELKTQVEKLAAALTAGAGSADIGEIAKKIQPAVESLAVPKPDVFFKVQADLGVIQTSLAQQRQTLQRVYPRSSV